MKLSTATLTLFLLCAFPAAHAVDGAGDSARGKTIFSQRCSMCHGDDGRGREGMAADLVGEWHRLTKSDQELRHNIKSGLRTPGKTYSAGQCPPNNMDDRDMDDVLNYLRNAFGSPQSDFGH